MASESANLERMMRSLAHLWERLRLPLMKQECRRETSSWHTTLDTTEGSCLGGEGWEWWGRGQKKVGGVEWGKGEI